MGGWHYKIISEKVNNIKVTGIYDIDIKAQRKAESLGLKVYPDLDVLLADRSIDMVIVSTPNDLHKEQTKKCLESGKNVICEKPAALNAQELEEMIAVAKSAAGLFTIHQNRRWDRDFISIKHIIKSRSIGDIYSIESRVQGTSGEMREWRGKKSSGGGIVLDWGVHLVDQLLNLTNQRVISVDAHLFKVKSEEVEDTAKIFLRFESGLSALVEMSTNSYIQLPRWYLNGTDGTAVIYDWSGTNKIVKPLPNTQPNWSPEIKYTDAGPTRTLAPTSTDDFVETSLPIFESNWSEFYRNFVDAVEGKAELAVKPEQVLNTMRIIDAAFLADLTNEPVKCAISED